MIKYIFSGIVAFLGTTFGMADDAKSARFCGINSVMFDKTAKGSVDARVSLSCRDSKFSDSIRYPSGKAFLGITLFRVRNASATSHNDESWDGSYLDLPYQRFDTRESELQIVLSTKKSTQGFNKYVAAVWAKEVKCWDTSRAGKCLGPWESEFGMPLPVDTYPRPSCDLRRVEQAQQTIYENWYFADGEVVYSFEDGEVERIESFLQSQHCVQGGSISNNHLLLDDSLNGIGFGFAIGKWPIANFRPR